ncbi:hypothetical protein JCM8097_007411 [Rhodosporidiobolus ruineniae]
MAPLASRPSRLEGSVDQDDREPAAGFPAPSSGARDSFDVHESDDEHGAGIPLLARWSTGWEKKGDSPSSASSPSTFSPSFFARSFSSAVPFLASNRKSRRSAYTSTAVLLVCVVLFSFSLLGWLAHAAYSPRLGRAGRAYAPSLVPEPKDLAPSVPAFPARLWMNESRAVEPGEEEDPAEAKRFAAIQDELDSRLINLGLPISTALRCADIQSAPDLLARYFPLRGVGHSPSFARNGSTFIALNLFDSEHIVPSLSRNLVSLARFLGPSTLHVSIFENGSSDRTPAALAHLAAALTALGTPHTIRSDPRRTEWNKVDRIDQLALFRNVLLEPLEAAPLNDTFWGGAPEDVVFANDVYWCPRDFLELLFQRRVQNADAACALDWRENAGPARWWIKTVRFYDNWVSRSITGQLLRQRFDVFAEWRDGIKQLFDRPGDEISRERFRAGLAIPVYSCFNGLIALSAFPFVSKGRSPRYHGPRKESSSWPRSPPLKAPEVARFRSAAGSEEECAASECKTLARDLWTRGFDRWLIVPTVRATYNLATYTHPQLVTLAALNPPSNSSLSLLPYDHSFHFPSSPPSPSPASPALITSAGSSSSSASTDLELGTSTELIPWSALSPPARVICYSWTPGLMIDIEWLRASWKRPFAGLRVIKWVDELAGSEGGR